MHMHTIYNSRPLLSMNMYIYTIYYICAYMHTFKKYMYMCIFIPISIYFILYTLCLEEGGTHNMSTLINLYPYFIIMYI